MRKIYTYGYPLICRECPYCDKMHRPQPRCMHPAVHPEFKVGESIPDGWDNVKLLQTCNGGMHDVFDALGKWELAVAELDRKVSKMSSDLQVLIQKEMIQARIRECKEWEENRRVV